MSDETTRRPSNSEMMQVINNGGLEQSKVPPNVSDLEEVVLGACMQSDISPDIIDILQPKSFYKLEHQKVFEAICELSKENNPIDILTVSAYLKKTEALDMVGGMYFVSQLTEKVASGENAEYHARLIQQKFIQREIIRISGDAYHTSFEDSADPLEVLDNLTEQLGNIDSEVQKEKIISNSDLVKKVIDNAEKASSGDNVTGLRSEISAVDKVTGGYQNGSFDILAARPAMGKSAKALQDAYHIGVTLGLPCVFFSLEMPSAQLMLRMMSHHLKIPAWKIKTGTLDVDEWEIINSGVQKIIDSPLVIIDNLVSAQDIFRKTRRLHKEKGLKMAFIDYLQLMSNPINRGNREQEISSISRGLKLLAKSLDIPVCALSQLSRAVESRGGDKKPMMSDLRESGSLEQDADQVMFLYRPEYYAIETNEEYGDTAGLTELILAKNRSGDTGTIPMRFHKETTSFSNWEENSFTAPAPPKSTPSVMTRSTEFDLNDDLDKKNSEWDDQVF
tara:strand:+ start:5608 stop:7122 length:1515 start_codon:yes stop_codon:yes gene_type:complete